MESNLFGTSNLLKLFKKSNGKRFVYISSGEIYGQSKDDTEEFYEEYSGYVDSTDPSACYPSSKRAAETLCAAYYKQYSIESVIARPCHIIWTNANKNR